MNSHTPPIAITTGEPAGIGPQISLLAALAWQAAHPQSPLVLIGDLFHLREVAQRFNIRAELTPSSALATLDDMSAAEKASILVVWHCPLFAPVNLGELDVGNAPYVLNTLDIALLGLKNGTFSAMVSVRSSASSNTVTQQFT